MNEDKVPEKVQTGEWKTSIIAASTKEEMHEKIDKVYAQAMEMAKADNLEPEEAEKFQQMHAHVEDLWDRLVEVHPITLAVITSEIIARHYVSDTKDCETYHDTRAALEVFKDLNFAVNDDHREKHEARGDEPIADSVKELMALLGMGEVETEDKKH